MIVLCIRIRRVVINELPEGLEFKVGESMIIEDQRKEKGTRS